MSTILTEELNHRWNCVKCLFFLWTLSKARIGCGELSWSLLLFGPVTVCSLPTWRGGRGAAVWHRTVSRSVTFSQITRDFSALQRSLACFRSHKLYLT